MKKIDGRSKAARLVKEKAQPDQGKIPPSLEKKFPKLTQMLKDDMQSLLQGQAKQSTISPSRFTMAEKVRQINMKLERIDEALSQVLDQLKV